MTGQVGDNKAAQLEAWQGVSNILSQAGGDFTKVDDTKLHQLAKYLDVLSPQGETEIYQKLIDQKTAGKTLDYALVSSFLDTGVPGIGLPVMPEIPQGNAMLANSHGFQIFMIMQLMITAEKEQKEALIPLIQGQMKLFIEYAQTVADSIKEAAATQRSILIAQAVTHFVEGAAAMATFVGSVVKMGKIETNIAEQKKTQITSMKAADEALTAPDRAPPGTRMFTDKDGKPLSQEVIDANVSSYWNKRTAGPVSEDQAVLDRNKAEDKLVLKATEANQKVVELGGSKWGRMQQDLFRLTTAQTVLGSSAKGISTLFEALMTTVKAESDATRAMYEQLTQMKAKLLDQLNEAFRTSESDVGKIQQQLQEWMKQWAQFIMGIQG